MDASDISDLYRLRVSASEYSRRNAIWRVICKGFLQRFINPSDTVIELACGRGEFINNITATKRIAIDLNPDTQQHLEEGVQFYNCDVTELAQTVRSKADVVFTSNFFEHLPNKKVLEDVLEQIGAVLKPAGHLLVLGPNLRFIPGEYWDYYDHDLGLTDQSLSEVLMLKGFLIEMCLDRFVPYRIKGGGLPTHPWLVWVYLKCPIAWRFLGKEFFIVARLQPPNRGPLEQHRR